jgi:hypothetical protein
MYPTSSAFSPDGKWVAYYQRPPGGPTGSLFVHAVQTEENHEVSRGGGIHPIWSRGEPLQLFYRLPQMIMRVDVTTRPTLGFTRPVEWLPDLLPLNPGPSVPRSMDATPDGTGFVTTVDVSSDPSQLAPATIRLVQHWTDELKQRVPVK